MEEISTEAVAAIRADLLSLGTLSLASPIIESSPAADRRFRL